MKFLKTTIAILIAAAAASASPTRSVTECAEHTDVDPFHPRHDDCVRTQHIKHAGTDMYSPEPFTVPLGADVITEAIAPDIEPANLLLRLGLVESGCYRERPDKPLFDEYLVDDETIESCATWARQRKYTYFGISNGGVCGGAGKFDKLVNATVGSCNVPCVLDTRNKCGGRRDARVFLIGPYTVKFQTVDVPDPIYSLSSDAVDTNGVAIMNPADAANIAIFTDAVYGTVMRRVFDARYPDSYVDCNIRLAPSYTKSAWIWIEPGTTQYPNILSSADISVPNQHYFYIDNGYVAAGHSATGVVQIVRHDAIAPVRAWQYYTVTYDHESLTMRLYHFGVLVKIGKSTYTEWQGAADVALGCYSKREFCFTGQIAQPTVFDTALSTEQVMALYRQFKTNPAEIVSEIALSDDVPVYALDRDFANAVPLTRVAGVSVGNPAVPISETERGWSVKLTGQNYVLLQNSTLHVNYTKMLWFRTDALTRPACLLCSNPADANVVGQHQLYVRAAGVGNIEVVAGHARTGHTDYVATHVTAGEWTHVAVTYEMHKMQLYINGVLAANNNNAKSMGMWTGGAAVAIGSFRHGMNFTGDIAQVAIYRKALSIGQVAAAFKTGYANDAIPDVYRARPVHLLVDAAQDPLYGKTLQLTGDQEYVTDAALPVTYSKTMWIMLQNGSHDTYYGVMCSAGRNPNTETGQHLILVHSMRIVIGHSETSQVYWIIDSETIKHDTWYHIAITYDDETKTMQYYRNGRLQSTAIDKKIQGTWRGGAAKTVVGNYRGEFGFRGLIAQPAIWNVTLSAHDILDMYITKTTPDSVTIVKEQRIGANVPNANNITLFQNNNINYRGGRIMLGTPAAYIIWYGDFSGTNTKEIITRFVTDWTGTPLYNTHITYWQNITAEGGVRFMSNTYRYVGAWSEPTYKYNRTIRASTIYYLVRDAIAVKALPQDNNAAYIVITAKDVTMSGFCTQFCGWHTSANMNGRRVRYGFVGDPTTQCMNSCTTRQNPSPNNNPPADGMCSIVAHEFGETFSDPDLNAWLDTAGYENWDRCAWNYGSMYTTANGGRANVKINGYDYLIQQNWVNAPHPVTGARGYCAMSYP